MTILGMPPRGGRVAAEAANVVRRRCAERANRSTRAWAGGAAVVSAVLAFLVLVRLVSPAPTRPLLAHVSIGDISGAGLFHHADDMRERVLAHLAEEGVWHDEGSTREVRIQVWTTVGEYASIEDYPWRIVVLAWTVSDGGRHWRIVQSAWVADGTDVYAEVRQRALPGAAKGIRRAMERAE